MMLILLVDKDYKHFDWFHNIFWLFNFICCTYISHNLLTTYIYIRIKYYIQNPLICKSILIFKKN